MQYYSGASQTTWMFTIPISKLVPSVCLIFQPFEQKVLLPRGKPDVQFGDSRVGKNPSGTVQGDMSKEFELGNSSLFSWEVFGGTVPVMGLGAASSGGGLNFPG